MKGIRWIQIVGAALMLALGSAAAGPAAAQSARIVAIGDSDTAGTSGAASSYPALLQKRLRDAGHDVLVHNAGVPGMIASQAVSRLGGLLTPETKIVILHFGTSDIKHNVSPAALRTDLEKMIAQIRQHGAKPLVVAGRLPAPRQVPSGYDARAYYAMYGELRAAQNVAGYRFTENLPSMQERSNAYQPDGHLTAEGNARVAEGLAPVVERLLKDGG